MRAKKRYQRLAARALVEMYSNHEFDPFLAGADAAAACVINEYVPLNLHTARPRLIPQEQVQNG